MNLNNFAVINASNPNKTYLESDVYVDYRAGRKSFFGDGRILKKCTSWHSLPAAFETEFFVYNKDGWQGIFQYDHVAVMIKDDLDSIKPLLKKLRTMGKVIGIMFHENGNYFTNLSQNLNWLVQFKEVCELANYYWNVNIYISDVFKGLLNIPIFDCYHAFPYFWKHGFNRSSSQKSGIIIGTRTLSQHLRRNTLYSLSIANLVARELDFRVTYLSEDNLPNGDLMHLFTKLFGADHKIKVCKGPLTYENWLDLIAPHRILFQTDASETLGQVVGDAAMVNVSTVGCKTFFDSLAASDFDIEFCRDSLKREYELSDEVLGEVVEEFKSKTTFECLVKKHQEELFPIIGKGVKHG